MELKVLDFQKMNFPTGLLVTRSAHWNKERCIKTKKKEIGIVTGFKIHEDSRKMPIVWPVVFWEKGNMDSTNHPANVDVYRKNSKPIYTTMIEE